uniref:ribosomal protein L5 n=1 Tax=Pseudoerythrocladia kornmannii TaxID=753682 RepID=UPI001BEF9C87|nr:ribosomal protein L5 [Pseudoerythrocladia kornmannii]QUE28271.1 ribosomal protein L5 [Pseudoerythrocladia kornmannii]UNJ16776.1 ribosomal protein L5 [Pseudoerythrocladia kornmannii]
MAEGLYELYKNKVTLSLTEHFKYNNLHQVPKIEKITINRGLGEASQNAKALEASINELSLITGQKPVTTLAKKSIAGFKLREQVPVGVMVTLRKYKMYSFLEKLINLSLPRIRDFRGISSSGFDGRGNFNMGLKEQLIFPELEYDQVEQIRGFNITIVTTAKTDEEAFKLLKDLGMPFETT